MSRRLSYNKKRYCLSPQSSFHRRHPLYIPHMTAYRFLYTSICKLPYRPDLFSDFHMVLHLKSYSYSLQESCWIPPDNYSTYLLLFSRSQSNPYLYRSLPPFRRSRPYSLYTSVCLPPSMHPLQSWILWISNRWQQHHHNSNYTTSKLSDSLPPFCLNRLFWS